MTKRFTLGTALLAILAIGVVLGLVANSWRQMRREDLGRAAMRAQGDVTSDLLQKARRDLVSPNVHPVSWATGAGRSGADWHETMRIELPGGPFIDIEVRGSRTAGTVHPIRILAKPAEANPEVIRRLTEEYRKRGWPCVVE